MNDEIRVAEQFFSLQGEGPQCGVPAIFLRLAGCNLLCGNPDEWAGIPQEEMEKSNDAEWLCDTIEVWRDASEVYTPSSLASDWRERGFLDKLRDGAHIVLTGGEPTLPHHQAALTEFLGELEEEIGNIFIEVETNGTIKPTEEFADRVNQFNISLKLSNSGMPKEKRLNDDALGFYTDANDTGTIVKFKFVIGSEDDVSEIDKIIDEYSIPDHFISLMPAGSTQEQLKETYPMVAELCKERCWDFSPRLHVTIWNEMVGV